MLSKVRNDKGLDIVTGLSSNIIYDCSTSKKQDIKKINEAKIEGRVAICGYERLPKATMPRILAHEIGHIEGLDHETPSSYRKVFLTLARGFKLERAIEFAESQSSMELTTPTNTIMAQSLDYLEKDGNNIR